MSFDGIAEAADLGADPAVVSTKLGETLQLCVARHEAYRFKSRNQKRCG